VWRRSTKAATDSRRRRRVPTEDIAKRACRHRRKGADDGARAPMMVLSWPAAELAFSAADSRSTGPTAGANAAFATDVAIK